MFCREGLDDIVLELLSLPHYDRDMSRWESLVARVKNPKHKVRVGIVGKYVEFPDAYKSLNEALIHGGIGNDCRVNLHHIDSEEIEKRGAQALLGTADGILVAPGFGNRGIEGKVDAVRYAREKGVPFFRLTEPTRSMPWLAPEGKSLVTADLGCDVGGELWRTSDEDLGTLCLSHVERIFPEVRGKYLGCRVLRTPIAYPVFLKEYEPVRRRFEISTGVDGLLSVGRNGEFAHLLMEDVYWRTLRKMRSLVASASTLAAA